MNTNKIPAPGVPINTTDSSLPTYVPPMGTQSSRPTGAVPNVTRRHVDTPQPITQAARRPLVPLPQAPRPRHQRSLPANRLTTGGRAFPPPPDHLRHQPTVPRTSLTEKAVSLPHSSPPNIFPPDLRDALRDLDFTRSATGSPTPRERDPDRPVASSPPSHYSICVLPPPMPFPHEEGGEGRGGIPELRWRRPSGTVVDFQLGWDRERDVPRGGYVENAVRVPCRAEQDCLVDVWVRHREECERRWEDEDRLRALNAAGSQTERRFSLEMQEALEWRRMEEDRRWWESEENVPAWLFWGTRKAAYRCVPELGEMLQHVVWRMERVRGRLLRLLEGVRRGLADGLSARVRRVRVEGSRSEAPSVKKPFIRFIIRKPTNGIPSDRVIGGRIDKPRSRPNTKDKGIGKCDGREKTGRVTPNAGRESPSPHPTVSTSTKTKKGKKGDQVRTGRVVKPQVPARKAPRPCKPRADGLPLRRSGRIAARNKVPSVSTSPSPSSSTDTSSDPSSSSDSSSASTTGSADRSDDDIASITPGGTFDVYLLRGSPPPRRRHGTASLESVRSTTSGSYDFTPSTSSAVPSVTGPEQFPVLPEHLPVYGPPTAPVYHGSHPLTTPNLDALNGGTKKQVDRLVDDRMDENIIKWLEGHELPYTDEAVIPEKNYVTVEPFAHDRGYGLGQDMAFEWKRVRGFK